MNKIQINSKYGLIEQWSSMGETDSEHSYPLPSLHLCTHDGLLVKNDGYRPLKSSAILVVPAGLKVSKSVPFSQHQQTVLCFQEYCFEICHKRFSLPISRLESIFETITQVVKTVWISEVVHRLLFETIICGRQSGAAVEFLFPEILKEVYYAVNFVEKRSSGSPASLVDSQEDMKAVLNLIQSRLAEELTVSDIAEVLDCSKATATRKFNRRFGMGPMKYVQEQRLLLAFRLLSTGTETASSVAARVGYQDLSAFSIAFKKRFQILPSDLLAHRS
ncbi:MAG: helix-turn-helix transcriptional regulator [Pseudobacteriovorax sp.]|nr:helix-turn-helix transcriptional regulator [Pseudobacteriovorax sp.]